MKAAFLCALAAVASLQPAADTVYVAPPTGEPGIDRANILAALEQVKPGGTVQFAAGTYLTGQLIRVAVPRITLQGHENGTTLRGCHPDQFRARQGERNAGCNNGLELAAGFQTVRRLTFEYTWHGVIVGCCYYDGSPAVELRSGGHHIEDNTFRNSVNGIRVISHWTEPVVIRNNVFINTFHAIGAYGSAVHVLDNTISVPAADQVPGRGFPSFAIAFGGGSGVRTCTGSVIAGNRIDGHTDGIILFGRANLVCREHTIRDNVIAVRRGRLAPVRDIIVHVRHASDSTIVGVPLALFNLPDQAGQLGIIEDNLVEGNRIDGAEGIAIEVYRASRNRIVNNRITRVTQRIPFPGNTHAPLVAWSAANGSGIWISPGSNENEIAGNRFDDIAAHAVVLEGDNNLVEMQSERDSVRVLGKDNRRKYGPIAQLPEPVYTVDFGRTLEARVQAHLAVAQSAINRLLDVRDPRTAENTLRPLDEAHNLLQRAQGMVTVAVRMHPDSAVRADGARVEQEIAEARSALRLDPRVARAIAEMDTTPLTSEERLITARLRRDYRRAGAYLDDTTRAVVGANLDALDRLGTVFSRNIAEDTSTIRATDEELRGLPDEWIAAHPRAGDGRVILTAQNPDFVPVFTHAVHRDVRRRIGLAWTNRAWPSNAVVLDSLLQLRAATARLLGYQSWAEYQAEIQMAGSVESVREFLYRVHAAASPSIRLSSETYTARLRRDDPSLTTLELFADFFYAAELIRREQHALDAREVSAYFPISRVKAGLLEIMGDLFELEFRRVDLPTWHGSVEAFEALDQGRVIGRFYLDLYPRAGKFQGGALFMIHPGIAGRQLPEMALVTNFPGGQPADPGLMGHTGAGSVSEFFHEFGHLIQGLIAQREYVLTEEPDENDFNEVPSTMLEELVWQPDVLQRFARHHETGETIPRELLQRMRAASSVGRSMDVAWLTALADLSLRIHEAPVLSQANLDAFVSETIQRHVRMAVPADAHVVTSWEHIGLNAYSATFYTYLWSQVIAKDLWSTFDPQRPLDPAPIRRYRDLVLRPGGSRPAAELVAEFLGRPFGFDSWRRWVEAR